MAPPTWTKYPLTQGFGPTAEPLDSGGVNKGYDVGTPVGTPIDAVEGGTVIAVGDSGDGWGISVKVRDANGYIHNYGHLSTTSVKRGQTIAAGALVGKSGNTGKSTGPHLSYDVKAPGGEYVDPLPFISGVGAPARSSAVQPSRELTPADEDRWMAVMGKVARGQSLTKEEAAFAEPYLKENSAQLAEVANGMFGTVGAASLLPKAAKAVQSAMGLANANWLTRLATGGAAVWGLTSVFGGDGDGGDDQQAPADEATLIAIMQKVASGQPLLPEELAILRTAEPQIAADYEALVGPGGSAATGGTAGFGAPQVDTEDQTDAEIFDAMLRAMVDEGGYSVDEIVKVAQAAQDARDFEAGNLRLDDGTVITQAMLENADPVTRQQYEMELASRRTAYENEATTLLNEFALDQYSTNRTATNDANATANDDYRNRLDYLRERLDLEEMTIDQVTAEVARMLDGAGESRARTQLETETALAAAPFATRDGKTSFTGNDLGAAVTGLARIGGVRNPETTPLISFPGTQRIDVRGTLQGYDQQYGVEGQLPEIPKITIRPEDIPQAPTLQAGPAAPTLIPPTVPAGTGYGRRDPQIDTSGYGSDL